VPIDFTIDEDVEQLRQRTAAFVRDVVIPAETCLGSGLTDEIRAGLQDAARRAGIFAPQVAPRWGGLGLDMRGQAVVFEAAGYSLLGPLALNCSAPDEGNMHLLERVATEEQKRRWLAPLAAGEMRSCFAMTEPAPGAGSDPTMLTTSARRVDGGWVVDGRKWYTSGAEGAALCICMARTGDEVDGRDGATMFLVPAETPGFRIVRRIESIDETCLGGHCEVALEDCRLGDDAVLGDPGRAFAYAQTRLAPARLTHCMRWLGLARRAHDFALDRALARRAFGRSLAEMGMVQQMVADSEIDLAASRSLIWHAAWVIDSSPERGGTDGGRGRDQTSIAKTFVSEAVNRVVDRSVQICGSLGVSGDALLGLYLREVRPFRIYDGPSEAHRWSIARRSFRRRAVAAAAEKRRLE
jgi:acyl-CoA dehydrogenase